jgi:hypothetical protein
MVVRIGHIECEVRESTTRQNKLAPSVFFLTVTKKKKKTEPEQTASSTTNAMQATLRMVLLGCAKKVRPTRPWATRPGRRKKTFWGLCGVPPKNARFLRRVARVPQYHYAQ